MNMDPSYTQYGLFQWLRANWREMLEHAKRYHKNDGLGIIASLRKAFFTGYAEITVEPKHVHLLVVVPLERISARYALQTEKRKAHEWGHCQHGPEHLDEADIMGPTFADNLADLGRMTDRKGVMAGSAAWRYRIRGKRSYTGSSGR